MLRRTFIFAALAVAALVLPAAAGAAVSTTIVTNPADHSFPYFNEAAATTGTITGTAPGAANGDLVDVTCTYPDSPAAFVLGVAANLAVNGGVWTTGVISLDPIAGQSCDLRAVPAGTTPVGGALAAFAAVRVNTLNDRDTSSNAPLEDFEIRSPGDDGSAQFNSLGGCAVSSMRLYGVIASERAAGNPLFYCNDYIWKSRLTPPGEAQRWPLTVDGARAHTSYDVDHTRPGAASLTYSVTTSPVGVTTVTESEPILTCATLTTPANPLSACASYAPTGVAFDRTMTVGSNGRTVRFVDTWRSVDGAPHAVDFWTEEDYNGAPGTRSVRLPGDAGYSGRASSEVHTVAPGVGTVFLRTKDDVADNSVEFAQGALTWDVAPDKVWFYGANGAYFHHAVAVPAAGSSVLRRQYAVSPTPWRRSRRSPRRQPTCTPSPRWRSRRPRQEPR